jgi:hypothetical protein
MSGDAATTWFFSSGESVLQDEPIADFPVWTEDLKAHATMHYAHAT